VLQIHGTLDRIRLPHAAERRATLLHNGRTELWPRTGHTPFLEHPDRFHRALAQLLTEAAAGL
jgi:pimeloyl-ACP methyl ester carboxylesterase